MRLTFLVVTVLAALASQSRVVGPSLSPCDAYGRADAVFIGEAAAPIHRNARQSDGHIFPIVVSPLIVERSFRGTSAPVVFITPAGAESLFSAGERYLVYGRTYQPPDIFMSSALYGSKRLSDAAQDVEFLESVLPNTPGATITGIVEVDESDAEHVGTSVLPMPNVAVRLTSGERDVTAVTSADGHFSASGLSAGTYQAEARLPSDLTLLDNGQFPPKVTLLDGGCVALPLRAIPNGRIGGVAVTWSGQPDVLETLSLVSAQDKGDRYSQTVKIADDGRFEFTGVRPGRYLIGRIAYTLNGQLIPTVYYPGTFDRQSAVTVEVGRSTAHDVGEFRLLPPPDKR